MSAKGASADVVAPFVPPGVAFAEREIVRTFRIDPLDLNYRVNARVAVTFMTQFGVRGDDFDSLIGLLGREGYLHRFLRLAHPDCPPEFREYLLANGIGWDRIHDSYDYQAKDSADFLAGYLLGAAESVGSIALVLVEIAQFLGAASVDPKAAFGRVMAACATIRQLDISEFIGKQWDDWRREFDDHLYRLEFFHAGYMLGKLVADILQLLELVAVLGKLGTRLGTGSVGIAKALARSSGNLAADAARAVPEMVAVLLAMGPKLVVSLRRVFTLELVALLVGEQGLQAMKKGLSWFEDGTGWMRFEGLAFAEASVGDGLEIGTSYVLFMEGKPTGVLHIPMEQLELGRLIDSVEAAVDRLGGELPELAAELKTAGKRGSKELAAEVLKQPSKFTLKAFVDLLRKARDDVVTTLKKAKERNTPAEIGTAIHTKMATRFRESVSAAYPKLVVLTETKIGTVMKRWVFRQGIAAMTVREFVERHHDLMRYFYGVDEDLKNFEKAVGMKLDSKLTDLQIDALVHDPLTGELMIVDWTSETAQEAFNSIERLYKAGKIDKATRDARIAAAKFLHANKVQMYMYIFERLFEGEARLKSIFAGEVFYPRPPAGVVTH